MPCQVINGKEIALQYRTELKHGVEVLGRRGIVPRLTVILVGNDPASQIYVGNKEKACREIGIASEVLRLPESFTEQELLAVVAKLNKAADVHGILVQLPLPDHIREERIIQAIQPQKDVDGLHPENIGNLLSGYPRLIPCTPLGCLHLLKKTGYRLAGKNAVVVGRSILVGKSVAALLLNADATVTVCHSQTKSLAEFTRQADVLVVAVGRMGLITGSMIKPGAFVMDVGMNRLPTGKLAGDVDFASASEVAGWLTPVPGGVGPMTITMLLANTLKVAGYGQ